MLEPRCCRNHGFAGRAIAALALAVAVSCPVAMAADTLVEARALKQKAIEHLKRAQSTGEGRASAARSALTDLNHALALLQFAPAGAGGETQSEIEQICSLIYWTRKMMPLTDAGAAPPVPEPPSGVSKEVLARKAYERAAAFAREHGDDPFMVAVRYFEVADRFPGTEYSLKAQKLSLENMQRALTSAGSGGRADAGTEPEATHDDTPTDSEAMTALARRLSAPGLTDRARVVACDVFLRTSTDESLRAEVTSARAMLAAEDDRARARAAQSHFKWFADGKLSACLPGAAVAAREMDAFDALAAVVRGEVAPAKRLELLRSFMTRYPKGVFAAEVRRVEAAYRAQSRSAAESAWLDYLVAFPFGEFTREARDALKTAEPTVMLALDKSLAAGDDERVEAIAGQYLRMYRRGPASAEVRELQRVLSSADRVTEARKMIAAYPNGMLTRTVGSLADRWERSGEEQAYAALKKQVAVASKDSAVKKVLDGFLKSYPSGAHSREIRLGRGMYTLASDNARHAAARKYLEAYPHGALTASAAEVDRAQSSRKEQLAFKSAMEDVSNPKLPVDARIEAAKKYLAQYPDTEGAPKINAAVAQVHAFDKEQRDAFAQLQRQLKEVSSPSEGRKLCAAYVGRYPASPHLPRVRERMREYERTVKSDEEERAFASLTEDLGSGGPWYARAERCVDFLQEYRASVHRQEAIALARQAACKRLGPHAAGLRSALFSDDAKILVTVDADGHTESSGIWLWDVQRARPKARYATRPAFTATAALSHVDDDRLIVGEQSGRAVVLDLATGSIAGRYYLGAGSLDAVAVVGRSVLTASARGSGAHSWDAGDWSLQSTSFDCPSGASALAVDSRAARVALGGRGGAMAVRNAEDDTLLWCADNAHGGRVDAVAFSPRGDLLASTSVADGQLCIWQAADGERLWHAAAGSEGVAFAGDGFLVTSTGLYRARDGTKLVPLDGTGPVAASSDGRFIFVAGDDSEGGDGEHRRRLGARPTATLSTGVLWYVPGLAAGQ